MLVWKDPLSIDNNDFYINWKRLASLPVQGNDTIQLGLSGAIIGNVGEKLIFAGGTNFKGEKPWRGGIKSYYDDIYILSHSEDNQYKWSILDLKLPFPLAYSSCISTSQGIIVIGGENHNGISNQVFIIKEVNDKLIFQNLPNLPIPLSNSCAVVDNSIIYLAGGNNNEHATTCFLSIDISVTVPEWQRLPDLPYPVSHAYLAFQFDGSENCVYLLGGRNKDTIVSNFYSSLWKYKPSNNIWIKEGEILQSATKISLSAGTCIVYKNKYIILLGGDMGTVFKKTELLNNEIESSLDYEVRQKLVTCKDKLLSSHPGFYKGILTYNTLKREWTKVSDFPDPVPVTTTAIYWQNKIFVLGGEIRPGVRTSNVYCGEIISK